MVLKYSLKRRGLIFPHLHEGIWVEVWILQIFNLISNVTGAVWQISNLTLGSWGARFGASVFCQTLSVYLALAAASPANSFLIWAEQRNVCEQCRVGKKTPPTTHCRGVKVGIALNTHREVTRRPTSCWAISSTHVVFSAGNIIRSGNFVFLVLHLFFRETVRLFECMRTLPWHVS